MESDIAHRLLVVVVVVICCGGGGCGGGGGGETFLLEVESDISQCFVVVVIIGVLIVVVFPSCSGIGTCVVVVIIQPPMTFGRGIWMTQRMTRRGLTRLTGWMLRLSPLRLPLLLLRVVLLLL